MKQEDEHVSTALRSVFAERWRRVWLPSALRIPFFADVQGSVLHFFLGTQPMNQIRYLCSLFNTYYVKFKWQKKKKCLWEHFFVTLENTGICGRKKRAWSSDMLLKVTIAVFLRECSK